MQPHDSLLLFVYGTLKRGERNHHIMQHAINHGCYHTASNYLLVELGSYPGMIEKSYEGQSIQGELFEIPCSLLDELNKIEEAPNLFYLEPITLANGSKAIAYLYKQSTKGAKILSKGIWSTDD